MKLRRTQFLLLLFISLSKEEFLKSNNNPRQIYKSRVRKRQNYEIVDENEPLAQIDVSSFIQSPDDNTIQYDSQEMSDFNIDDSAVNKFDVDKSVALEYQNLNPDSLEANSYKDHNIISKNIDENKFSEDYNKDNPQRKEKIHFDRLENNFAVQEIRPISHNEKKCALKKMRFPFFSHSKSKTIKPNKNKKRKWNFHNSKKYNPSVNVKDSGNNLNSKATAGPKNFKIKKRSYFDRLCPACKQKVLNVNLVENKRRSAMNNVKHNSRQRSQKTEQRKNININRYGGERLNNKYENKAVEEKERNWKNYEDVTQRKVNIMENGDNTDFLKSVEY